VMMERKQDPTHPYVLTARIGCATIDPSFELVSFFDLMEEAERDAARGAEGPIGA
jgi:hypothetical protein